MEKIFETIRREVLKDRRGTFIFSIVSLAETKYVLRFTSYQMREEFKFALESHELQFLADEAKTKALNCNPKDALDIKFSLVYEKLRVTIHRVLNVKANKNILFGE